jgi:competence protein ComEA
MLKKILLILATLYTAASFAGVDVNRASEAELDSINGVGPSISSKILDERKKGNFKDWADLIHRVHGVGEANATRLSNAGLTVGGVAYKAASTTSGAKEEKAASKAEPKRKQEAEK